MYVVYNVNIYAFKSISLKFYSTALLNVATIRICSKNTSAANLLYIYFCTCIHIYTRIYNLIASASEYCGISLFELD